MWRSVGLILFGVTFAITNAEKNTTLCDFFKTPYFNSYDTSQRDYKSPVTPVSPEAVYRLNHWTVSTLENKTTKESLHVCFTEIVREHIKFGSEPRECHQVADLGAKMEPFHKKMIKECNPNTTINYTNFFNFMDFSLKDGQFERLYNEDRNCLINGESKINDCIHNTLGFSKNNHTSFYRKITLNYSKANCKFADSVKNCTLGVLKECKNTTRDYVGSLFDYVHKNCINISDSSPNGASSMNYGHHTFTMTVLFMLMTSALVMTGFL